MESIYYMIFCLCETPKTTASARNLLSYLLQHCGSRSTFIVYCDNVFTEFLRIVMLWCLQRKFVILAYFHANWGGIQRCGWIMRLRYRGERWLSIERSYWFNNVCAVILKLKMVVSIFHNHLLAETTLVYIRTRWNYVDRSEVTSFVSLHYLLSLWVVLQSHVCCSRRMMLQTNGFG